MRTDEFVSLLSKVKACGQDKYMACCPAHDDKDPSLSIAAAPGGKILLHCWAGCSALEVVQSLGLQLADLFDKPLDYERPMAFAQRERAQVETTKSRLDHERMILALGYADRKAGKKVSRADMAREREAFMALREAGVEASPEVLYLWAMDRQIGR